MRKILFTILLSILAIAPVLPCDQEYNIKKAFKRVESVLSRSVEASDVLWRVEAEQALRAYYKEYREACEDCMSMAIFEFHVDILKLERILERCRR